MSSAAVSVRALVHRGGGRAPAIERLWLDPPRAGEVRVRMAASGVCRSDLHVVDGEWERPSDVVLGHEGAGWVDALGPGVVERDPDAPPGSGGHRVGDLVVLAWTAPCDACPSCARGEPWLCTAPRGGGHRLAADAVRLHRDDGSTVGAYSGIGTFASSEVVVAEAAVPIDPRAPVEVAALIGCAASTGVGAVRRTAGLRPGETAAIIGLGGVGLAALVAAHAVGADPLIAVDREASKRDLAMRLGATMAMPPEDLPAVAARLPSGGLDHVLECVGLTATVELAIASVRPGGTATLVGMTAQGERAAIDVYRFVEDGTRLLGSNYGSLVPGRDIPALASDVVEGRLPLGELVGERIALEGVGDALVAMRRREGMRRVVVF